MIDVEELTRMAMQTARTEALIEAEKAVRDRITTTMWAGEARALRLAADAIRHLPARYLPVPTMNPDCVVGKHRACRGDAWDARLDRAADCVCDCHLPAGGVAA